MYTSVNPHMWTCLHAQAHHHTHTHKQQEREVSPNTMSRERERCQSFQSRTGRQQVATTAGRNLPHASLQMQGSWEADQGGKAEGFKGLLRSWDLMLCVVKQYRETSRPTQGKTHAPPTPEVSRGCLKGCGRPTFSLRCHQIGGFIFQWLLQLLSARLCNTKCWNVLLYPREISSVRDEWGHRN